ncbi:hypothetical protein FBY31_4544 [Arthrobacter sp. SLBN-100]|uniref:dihydrodiol dehydrogenase n=1 Tax=Arthrobacter sp. SLBN-100 TaxID=2768450 RepID=UPI001174C51B|nr:dihydrodiol dehydrogenase [Arthrobacter sp. SLBN-100]TQJ62155.1 hypothetical protein FBY31_4544 [Arthrobacter sp. SLBN-100]
MTATDAPGDDCAEQSIVISNEFAEILVRKVHTRNGERLKIESRRRGHEILLDSLQLEGLTWQPKEVFSGFLRSSVGRGDDDG